jgi:molecular chaperone GrpE
MDNTRIKEEVENNQEQEAVSENAASADQPVSETQELPEAIKIKEELAGAKDKYLRLYSEFENFRRRTAKEKLEMVQSANEQLIKAMLPVADDFERAERSYKEKNSQDGEGFLLIYTKFKKILELHGVKVMEVKTGSDFDPDIHEAITQVPAPSPELKGKVVDVVEKGYLLTDKVIRFAKVVVGS